MSVNVRTDSVFQYAAPYFDDVQGEYVWGIADPPDAVHREDDQFYNVRQGDRFDLISYQMLGDPRYFWIIMHYNNIGDAMAIDNYIGQDIRIPSRQTLEKVYLNGTQQPTIG